MNHPPVKQGVSQLLQNVSRHRSRLVFGLFIFLPIFICFFLPMVFFKWPVSFTLHTQPIPPYVVTFKMALHAFAIALVWFLIAFGVLCLPFGKAYDTKVREWPPFTIYLMAIVFGIVGIAALLIRNYVPMPTALKQPIYLFSHMPMMSVVFALYAIRFGYSKLLCYSLVLINFIIILWVPLSIGTASSIAFTFIAITYALVCIRYSVRNLVWVVLFFILSIAAVMLVKRYIRGLWGVQGVLTSTVTVHNLVSDKTKRQLLQRIKLDFDLSDTSHLHLPSSGMFKYFNYPVEKILIRLNRLSQLAYILDVVPRKYPYLHGYTYKPILYTFIPRFIWKNKPSIQIGTFFAHHYGFVRPARRYTSIALPYPTEAWINYGWVGVILSALIIGFAFRFLWASFMGGFPFAGNIMIGMVIVYAASRAEASAMMVFGNLLQAVILFWMLDYCIRKFSNRFISQRLL